MIAAAVAVVAIVLRCLVQFLDGMVGVAARYEVVLMRRAVRRRFEATLVDHASLDEAERLARLSNELTQDLERQADDVAAPASESAGRM